VNYLLSSVRTLSYWRYALFSLGGISRILAIMGGIYLLLEMLDFFGMYTRDRYSNYAFFVVLAFAIVAAVISRRPVTKVTYRVLRKDFTFEVLIGDLLETPSPNVVISTNTTFDTDIAGGVISPDSLQGKFTNKYFAGNTNELDKQLNAALKGVAFEERQGGKGKKRRYPIGTVAKVGAHGKTFYLLAMSELNDEGTAKSTPRMIDQALEALWTFVADKGEFGDIATAIIGTGRGRVGIPRKKVVERIAQTFADASQDKVFANRLTIVVHPGDAERFGVNLFEIKDYLLQSLNV
jgi:hypothetical protein